jgi:hypothetical protein
MLASHSKPGPSPERHRPLCARGEELAANRLRGGASVRLAVGASLNSTSINSPSPAPRASSPPGAGVRADDQAQPPEGEGLRNPDSARAHLAQGRQDGAMLLRVV